MASQIIDTWTAFQQFMPDDIKENIADESHITGFLWWNPSVTGNSPYTDSAIDVWKQLQTSLYG